MEHILNEETVPQFKKFGVNIFGVDSSLSEIDGAKEAITKFKDFLFNTLAWFER